MSKCISHESKVAGNKKLYTLYTKFSIKSDYNHTGNVAGGDDLIQLNPSASKSFSTRNK